MSGVRSFTVLRFVGKRRENYVFRVCMVLHEDIMVWGRLFRVSRVMCVIFRVCMSLREIFYGLYVT